MEQNSQADRLVARIESGMARMAVVGNVRGDGRRLAEAFAKWLPTLAFDASASPAPGPHGDGRSGEDPPPPYGLCFSSNPNDLHGMEVYLVTVPTAAAGKLDILPLLDACRLVGSSMQPGALVVLQSALFPGCTEEDCVPILERESGLCLNHDFFCGYSPPWVFSEERPEEWSPPPRLVSGSNSEALQAVDALFRVLPGVETHFAATIRLAETARLVESCYRHVSRALANELAMFCERIGVDTLEVIASAFPGDGGFALAPGLDDMARFETGPLCLVQKAKLLGLHPQVVLAGLRTNDGMGRYVGGQIIKSLIRKRRHLNGAHILFLGLVGKEEEFGGACSQVLGVIGELEKYGCEIVVHDPLMDAETGRRKYGLSMLPDLAAARSLAGSLDGIVVAVPHSEYCGFDLAPFRAHGTMVYDLPGIMPRHLVDGRL